MKLIKTSVEAAPQFVKELEDKGKFFQFDFVGDNGSQETRVMNKHTNTLEIDFYFQAVFVMEVFENGITRSVGYFQEVEVESPKPTIAKIAEIVSETKKEEL